MSLARVGGTTIQGIPEGAMAKWQWRREIHRIGVKTQAWTRRLERQLYDVSAHRAEPSEWPYKMEPIFRPLAQTGKQDVSGAESRPASGAIGKSDANISGASEQTVIVAGDKGANPQPKFPRRASWLKDRLIERGWGNSDPSTYRGPDRKTIEKILRGQAVRNDVIEKLAAALSRKSSDVRVLDIPQD
jgi:hypothetical protein